MLWPVSQGVSAPLPLTLLPFNTRGGRERGWWGLSAGMIASHMNGFAQAASTQVKGHRERAVDCPGEENSLLKSPQGSGHMEQIQHYQEELRKRREDNSQGRVDVDPNTSLKLKKLSENPKVGIDNPTFEDKEKFSTNSCPQDYVAGKLWQLVGYWVEVKKGRKWRRGISGKQRSLKRYQWGWSHMNN